MQRFAWRQLELMQKEGLSEAEALKRVEAEAASAGQRGRDGGALGNSELLVPPPSARVVIADVQAEEEAVLRKSAAYRESLPRRGG